MQQSHLSWLLRIGNRQRYYRISDCVSDELWTDMFNNWAEFELLENQRFESQQQEVA